MKTIGLIGGMSWESTVPYYRIINETVREKLGGFHSAELILYSLDFHEIEQLQSSGAWDESGQILAQAAQALQAAGAEFLVLCTNTMHKIADAIEKAVIIPLLHIADATAQEIMQAGITKVGLLGTRFTMEHDFYRGRLRDKHHLDVLIPDDRDREIVHKIIYDELCMGVVCDTSRAEYRRIIQRLADQGAQGVILGCTEISMLVGASDSPVPLFDTTSIHARKAAEYALGK
jgi:aspartate racemase